MNKSVVAVGGRIKTIRKEKGLSQEDFGKMIDNAHKTLVSKWEKGQNFPTNKRLKIIAELANISVEELLGGKEMVYLLNGIKYTEILVNEAEKELILAMRESKKKCDAEEKGNNHAKRN